MRPEYDFSGGTRGATAQRYAQSANVQRVIAGRYVIDGRIGEGRMSTVYRARDVNAPDAVVAIKVLDTSHPDEVKRALYERETAALKRLAHPNIVRLRGAGWSDDIGAFYLVLDYLPFALDRFLRGEEDSARPPDPHRIVRELAEALGHAHSEGVIHRDVKPSNIMLDADGRAMLADFGISKLLDQLTVGETLARFFSTGYASPEQQSARPADGRSDVYSLGAVYYRMLSGQEPPQEGPTPESVDIYVKAPNPLKQALKRMLATSPNDRPQSGVELLTALSVTYRHEDLPRHFLVVTNNAFEDLVSSDYHPRPNFEEVADVLSEDLGGRAHAEVHVLVDPRDRDDLIVLGDSLRLVCTKFKGGDALAVKAVHQPYMPTFDAEKSKAMAVRAIWIPVESHSFRTDWDHATLLNAGPQLRQLLSDLTTHETIGRAISQRRSSRREFIERWRQTLVEIRRRIVGDSPILHYSGVEREGGRLRFSLIQDPPDRVWADDTPLVIGRADGRHSTPVGNLVEIRGRTVEVAEVGPVRYDTLPQGGVLAANTIEALAENGRQQQAVNDFLAGQTANPDLATAIVDPSTATRGAAAALHYYQPWLSADKKEAVAEALASNELFLIQGPPGTGKTSVIAELVLQILKKDPKARVLLSSQSNVAVDHALTRIAAAAEAAQEPLPAMVRVGRREKIGHGGEKWTLRARADALRDEILERCRPTLDKLKRDERRARRTAKAASVLADEELREAGDIAEWILEAEDLVGQLEDYEHEAASMGPDASMSIVDSAGALVERARDIALQHIGAVNDLLSSEVDLGGLTPREALNLVAASAVPSRREQRPNNQPSTELYRIQQLRKVLSHWTRVAGRGRDFEDLVGKSSSVVAATCSISGRLARNSGTTTSFDWAIVDEAGRATVPEVLVPIVNADRVVLVGDERQLPPMVDEGVGDGEAADGERLDKSLFQALVEQVGGANSDHLASLRTQYRMHPSIGTLVSDVFYGRELENGNMKRRSIPAYSWLPARVIWLSTSEQRSRQESRRGRSFFNVAEVEIVAQLLKKFEGTLANRPTRLSVGVITGYAGQVEQVQSTIDPANGHRWKALDIEVATVDSFQGRERDIVIYSTVRSNRARNIGFQSDFRRVNVALSRAREALVIVGDVTMMEAARVGEADNPFAHVIRYMRTHREDCRILPAKGVRLL